MFGVALLVLAISLVLVDVDAQTVCFDAKTCIHNGVERCGVNTRGNVRRFLDSCDIKEYNCLRRTDYVQTDTRRCRNLSPLEEKTKAKRYEQLPLVHDYWCWRASFCHLTRTDERVCAKNIQDRTRVFKIFRNQCSVFRQNCWRGTGLINVLFILQNNNSLASKDETNTAILISQYYCHRLKECTPGRGAVCGYSEKSSYLSDFQDECAMFRVNCDGNGQVIFYIIEKEICEMKKRYLKEHKNEVFEFEHISRVTLNPSLISEGYRVQEAEAPEGTPKQKPYPYGYPQRMKLAKE